MKQEPASDYDSVFEYQWTSYTPTMRFRLYRKVGLDEPEMILQQMFISGKGEHWLDVPHVEGSDVDG